MVPFKFRVCEKSSRANSDKDAAVFLGQKGKGKIARVVGRIKKRGAGNGDTGFAIQILLVWEAKWEDVELMKKVVG